MKVFGITLLKRIIRPGTPRLWNPDNDQPWNHVTLHGGPSVRLNIKFSSGSGEAMPTEQEVIDDGRGKLMGAAVKSIEKDLEINGFQGFAAVRELPSGSSAMGLEVLGSGVILCQWWLSGHGLDFEIDGIAPKNSGTLRETLDLVVRSLRPKPS